MMLQISEQQWEEVKRIHQESIDKNKVLQKEVDTISEKDEEIKLLKEKNKKLEDKLAKEQTNFKLVYEHLDKTFKLLEEHGLKNKYTSSIGVIKTITTLDLYV